MTELATAAVGVAGIVGVLLAARMGTRATLRAVRMQLEASERQREEEAAMDFLAAAHLCYTAISELPPVTRDPLAGARKAIDKVIPGAEAARYLKTRERERKYVGDDIRAPMQELVRAAARLQVLSTGDELSSAIQEMLDYLEGLASERSPEQLQRWPVIRDQLVDAIQAVRPTPI